MGEVEEIPHLSELAVVAATSVVVSLIVARWRFPTVTGLLAAGALIGPLGLSWVHSSGVIHTLAELGVVFLLFSIGLEFSLARLRSIARHVALGGGAQVGLTVLVATLLATVAGRPLPTALLYGFVFSLSSTAIVLRALSERRELDAPHGKLIVGTLVFQDLCVVPMVLLVPVLGEGDPASALGSIALALFKAVLVVAAVVFFARTVVPRLMRMVDASRSSEVFLITVLMICIGTAWITSRVGLSLAFGAFLGGIVVADTEFGRRALGDMLPLRDAFVSVFFVSLGMLFDGRVLFANPVAALALLFGFLIGKGLVAIVGSMLMRFPARAALLAGIGVAQFGEFGFVLAQMGERVGLLGEDETRVLLASGLISMFLTPILVRVAPRLAAGQRLLAPLERILGAPAIDALPEEGGALLQGHVVVVGFGIGGKLVANALDLSRIEWIALELNSATVAKERAVGRPVYYGDATHSEALEHAGVRRAAALVIATNDRVAVLLAVQAARRLAPDVFIVVRARYLAEAPELEALGVSQVVSEEVESGLELVGRVLRRMDVPRNVIEAHGEESRRMLIRAEPTRLSTLRHQKLGEARVLEELEIDNFLVEDGAPADGRSLSDLDLRQTTGVLAVALRRDSRLFHPPPADVPLLPGDVVFVVGPGPSIAKAGGCFVRSNSGDRARG